MTVQTGISLFAVIVSFTALILSRADKKNKDTKEESKEEKIDYSDKKLIEYRLEQLEKKIDKVLDILDTYDGVIDEKVKVAMDHHIKEYHKEA